VSEVLLQELDSRKLNYCFCFGARILVGRLLETYRNRIVNFHPSLLPSFAGLKAVDQALEYGAPVLGNTAHFIDEGVDTGPIIMQSMLPRALFDDYDSVLDLQMPMMAQIMEWLSEDRVELTGRAVTVRGASYRESFFVPNIELDLGSCVPAQAG